MARMRYTRKHIRFLRKGYLSMRIPALTEAFNEAFGFSVTPAAIKATLNNHKIRCGRPTGTMKGERLEYTEEQEQFLREHYPLLSRGDLARAFNEHFGTAKTAMQIVFFVKRRGITSGRTGCFPKGHRPWNTGTKGLVPPNSGQFKPGSVPGNLKEEGFERVNVYGYIEVKVNEPNPYTGAPTRFRLKHVVVWESAHGPVPKGHKLRFIDGDKLNCALENLEMVNNAEHLRLNQIGYAEAPMEAKPVVRTLAALEVKAFQRKRKG